MNSVRPTANSEIAYDIESHLKASTNYFDPAGTSSSGAMSPDTADLTFIFDMTVKFKRPLKL